MTTKKTTETSSTSRFRAALDELFEAAEAYKADNPSKTSFVADDGFKVEFAGPQLYRVTR